MDMIDFSKAFPRKVNIDRYMPIITAAGKAANGADGVPRVVVETYESYKEATRAANAIRNYARSNKLELNVSCPENGQKILVWKAKPRTRRKKADAPAPERPPVTDGAAEQAATS